MEKIRIRDKHHGSATVPNMRFDRLACHIQAFRREFLKGLFHITWLEKNILYGTKWRNETKRLKYGLLVYLFIMEVRYRYDISSSKFTYENFEQINPLDSKIHSVQLITSGNLCHYITEPRHHCSGSLTFWYGYGSLAFVGFQFKMPKY